MRKEKKLQEKKPFFYFFLQHALPEGEAFVLNPHLGTLVHLQKGNPYPKLLFEEQLTDSECSLLLPLLEAYPHYCPYEVLFAHFYSGKNSDMEEAVKKARQRLQEAQYAGLWDYELRPLRNVVSRIRLKIEASGLHILSLLETGYILDYKKSEKA